jgi:anaerobic magnesium-protoporphyrin IX monomethyl ester cyclase
VEAAVFDRDGCRGGLDELIREILAFTPDVCGLPVFSAHRIFRDVRAVVKELRTRLPRVVLVLGGPHASAWPEETLRWYPEVDFVLRGEADFTLCELVDQLDQGAGHVSVSGLSYRSNGGVTSVPLQRSPTDLDAIPIPDRSFLWKNYERGVYWRIDRKGPVDYVMTGRGCPFDCNFCFKLDRGYRPRSPENVVAELAYLESLGITSIDVEDDLFTVNKPRCLKICRLIREAGLKLDLKVRSRVDTIDGEMLAELRRAGVRTVVYGFESGSQEMLDAMNKRIRVSESYKAVRATKRARLACYADIFIGYPGENDETLAMTKEFLLKTRPTALNIGVLEPLPNTRVYLDAKANGTLRGDWAIDAPTPYVQLPWVGTRSDLWTARNRMARSFYSNPLVAFGVLRHALPRLHPRMVSRGVRFVGRVLRG